MQCPHCLVAIHVGERTSDPEESTGAPVIDYADQQGQAHRWIERTICPACNEIIIALIYSPRVVTHPYEHAKFPDANDEQRVLVWPRHIGRSPVPPEVPNEFSKDYKEACVILSDSPNASAALSRRCLQLILRKKLGANGVNLYEEIQWAISEAGLPTSVTDVLDAPRKVGNRAAHPMSSISDPGVVVDVEPWEAEWCLEVIDALYDHLFVSPARNDERLKRLERALGR